MHASRQMLATNQSMHSFYILVIILLSTYLYNCDCILENRPQILKSIFLPVHERVHFMAPVAPDGEQQHVQYFKSVFLKK